MYEYHNPEIKILLCDYRENINSWRHENVFNSWWYLYWNDSSGAIVETEKSTYCLEPDKFCLIAPETVFSISILRQALLLIKSNPEFIFSPATRLS
jgi:hypothetical protein